MFKAIKILNKCKDSIILVTCMRVLKLYILIYLAEKNLYLINECSTQIVFSILYIKYLYGLWDNNLLILLPNL